MKNKKLIQVLLCTILVSLLATTAIRPVNAIWIEYVGRETKDQWVPYFILYDPPGDSSYGRIEETTEVSFDVSFSGHFWDFGAIGGFGGDFVFTSGSETPNNEQMSCVLAKEFSMTWDVYYVITPRTSYYKADLVSASEYSGSEGIIRFDNLDNYGIIVDDQTGEAGAYSYHKLVDRNAVKFNSLEYSWSESLYSNLGISFTAKGVAFDAGVKLDKTDTDKFEAYYYYKDTTHALDFYLYSNIPIDFGTSDPDFVGSTQIWFSE